MTRPLISSSENISKIIDSYGYLKEIENIDANILAYSLTTIKNLNDMESQCDIHVHAIVNFERNQWDIILHDSEYSDVIIMKYINYKGWTAYGDESVYNRMFSIITLL